MSLLLALTAVTPPEPPQVGYPFGQTLIRPPEETIDLEALIVALLVAA